MEKLTTAQNKTGDVVTYLCQDDKHTMFTFDTHFNKSYIETLTKNEDTGEYSYISVDSEGNKAMQVYALQLGLIIISTWENTQNYVDSLDWQE